ncbi:hypothetical protein CBER1_03497 [Cercospora berteroae]|uniref:AA1-like domain-containing protein n=1 Tax=Cercospora berteroae TaxID=357750 RepID=A0A2S6CFW7_9PEZI|nr:hypothetical protein CBER1_03497 [Cercospora berteroae]
MTRLFIYSLAYFAIAARAMPHGTLDLPNNDLISDIGNALPHESDTNPLLVSRAAGEVTCSASYKFFFEDFSIRGKNVPDSKLGDNGSNLRQQLIGCGALTKWKFEWTPNDGNHAWHATGRLPIGTKACVGRALNTALGAGSGGC